MIWLAILAALPASSDPVLAALEDELARSMEQLAITGVERISPQSSSADFPPTTSRMTSWWSTT